MKSGGYLVINPTEALTSIDINSGRATSEKNIEIFIFLKKHNIATGVHFYPMTLQPLFKKYKSRCINSENIQFVNIRRYRTGGEDLCVCEVKFWE